MANSAQIAFSTDFLASSYSLPKQIQGKVIDFIAKLQENPALPSLNVEKIRDAFDTHICSLRIDDAYRVIASRTDGSGTFMLLWVDHHDEAYEWARRRRCKINPVTGAIQVYVVQETKDEPAHSDVTYLFSAVSNDQLLLLAVPTDLFILTRKIKTVEEFKKFKNSFPIDAYENLNWIADGFPVDEVINMILSERCASDESISEDDFEKALNNPITQMAFTVINGEKELRDIMSAPLEKWRVFLHPVQRKIVSQQYNGPARVLGGAGTGKTVVAMHRAKWLASQADEDQTILFTTFTKNLAGDILDNLRKICNPKELKKIEVVNLDAWISGYLRNQGSEYEIVYGEQLDEIWDTAMRNSGLDLEFSRLFYHEEWVKVVEASEAYTIEKYMKTARLGRGTRLDRSKRIRVWAVFKEYLNLMEVMHKRDPEHAMFECKEQIIKSKGSPIYSSIVVDEGQDLSMSAYRLLRAMSGDEHKNDLFIVGDTHQRIYRNNGKLSKANINIRGRSSYLKINYRTPEEIRRYAFSILKNISFDDLDDGYDEGKECTSLITGYRPLVSTFDNQAKEIQYIFGKVNSLVEQGSNHRDICIVVRTNNLIESYRTGLAALGLRALFKISQDKQDDRSKEGVRIATMHRVKGLEFDHVIIAACNHGLMPLRTAIDKTDMVSEEECVNSEKCLLYVSLTRARKTAEITSFGQLSELVEIK